MTKVHDRGGWPTNETIDQSQHVLEEWEIHVDALSRLLNQKGINCRDETRFETERLSLSQYEGLRYYEKWAVSAENILVDKGFITREELDLKMADL